MVVWGKNKQAIVLQKGVSLTGVAKTASDEIEIRAADPERPNQVEK